MIQTRRQVMVAASLLGASFIRLPRVLAEDGPPETTTIRIAKSPSVCLAPSFVADELLRIEGFNDIQYVPTASGFSHAQLIARGEADFGATFVGSAVHHLDVGLPITIIGGVHSGCYELFAHEPIRTISDLKGKRVGITTLASSGHLYVAIMAKYVGLDPEQDITWVTHEAGNPLDLFAEHKTDAFLGFPPEPQALRARNVSRVILKTAFDKPWSQYLCCVLITSREFATSYPVASKRALRAFLKAADFCAASPASAAQQLVDRGFTDRYDFALQALSEVPYTRWRDYDLEDTVRFYALQLYGAGMIKSNPNELIAAGTDLKAFEALKTELKL